MARLALTPKQALGSYPTLPLSAGAATLTEAAPGTAADGVSFPLTGAKQLLIVHNLNASAQTVTITSVADARNRTGDITTYSIPAAGIAVFGSFEAEGWKQSDGSLYAVASHIDVKFAVVNL